MRGKSFGGFVLDLLFPPRCAWCGAVLGFVKDCGCTGALDKCRLPACALKKDGRGAHMAALDGVWACFPYKPPVSEAYLRLKFEGETELAEPMGKALAAQFEACRLAGRFDAILPVPVSPKTLARRGYNQSLLLAGVLARETGLPLVDGLLHKTRETQKQMDLGREERLVNVLHAYTVQDPEQAASRRFLLVDDVLTTGSTLSECARTLQAAGAKSCAALTLMAVE